MTESQEDSPDDANVDASGEDSREEESQEVGLCEFCLGGLMVPPDTELPTGDGATFSQAGGYAATLTAADAEFKMALLLQTIC